MRVMIEANMPVQRFNEAVKNGTAGPVIKQILEETRPEAVYFTENGGHRTCVMIVDMAEASQIPSLAEPWFLNFDAEVHFRIVMLPSDLMKAGLEGLGQKWTRVPVAV